MLVESGKLFVVRYEVVQRQRKEQKTSDPSKTTSTGSLSSSMNLYVFFFVFVDFFPSYVPCTTIPAPPPPPTPIPPPTRDPLPIPTGWNLKVLLTEFIWITKDVQKTKVLVILDINQTEESIIYKLEWK